jgi:threonine dehydrogenase-like Zn-dependent dehydrogenase
MKALQLEKPQTWRTIDLPEPAAPGPGEALVRVQRVGICGTDLGGYLGKMPFFTYPRVPGHELGVEVLAIGEGVANVQPWRPLLGGALPQLPAVLLVPARLHKLLRESTGRSA